MENHSLKSKIIERTSVAEQLSSVPMQSATIALEDNRPSTVLQQKIVQLFSEQETSPIQFTKQNAPSAPGQDEVVQRVLKDIPPPTEKDHEMLNSLNKRNLRIVEKYNLIQKGTHGTNWQHAISIMETGIKGSIPQEERTSDVTPEHGGFFVDISEDGKSHSHDFAHMAAYGEPTIKGDTVEEELEHRAANKQQVSKFEALKEAGKGTYTAIVLQIWGDETALPQKRKEAPLQQVDEDIYIENAHKLIATIKYGL